MKTRRTWALVLSAVMVLAAGGLLAQPLLAAWPFNAEGSFERTLSVTGEVDLNVTTGSGSITVRPGESGRVYVKAQIRARGGDAEEKVRRLEASPPIEQNGNVIRIGRIEDRELRRNVSISYELVVPATTRLKRTMVRMCGSRCSHTQVPTVAASNDAAQVTSPVLPLPSDGGPIEFPAGQSNA